MNDLQSPLLLVAYGFSNLVGLLILWAAFRRPRLARLAFLLLFAWAAWTNYTTSHDHPDWYLSYSRWAWAGYNDFISGWFSRHITVTVSAIAIAQGLIALSMGYRGVWLKTACLGAIIFLLAIAPLGYGAAFPFPLVFAFAAWKMLRRDECRPLWERQQLRHSHVNNSKS
ncbi:MAG: hypothetical protein WC615_02760 [Mucilaginibacter sp.]|jgi:hypothetical protein|uniref:hypothetical protein n=1 Tax=Mucilaginibacter sp. TaxID=1882438 RepID=UPI0035698DD1